MSAENLAEIECDGVNPESGLPCVLGRHRGFHEDERGSHWLDD
jgi:hypothetical protein